jgi:tetratricopeptide (TPR) repeat protein
MVFNDKGDEAIEALDQAANELGDLESDVVGVGLAAELARAYMMKGEPIPSLEWCERALVAGERLGLIPLIAEALTTKGSALGLLGRIREQIALLTGALQLTEQQGLVRPRLRALNNLAEGLWTIDPPGSIRLNQEQLELTRRWGLRDWERGALENLANTTFHFGHWELTADAMAEAASSHPLTGVLRVTQVELDALRGNTETATDALRTLQAEFAGSSNRDFLWHLIACESELALASGDLDRAHERAMQMVAVGRTANGRAWSHWFAAWPALWSRDINRARAALHGLTAQGLEIDVFQAASAEIAAGVAGLEGRRDEALEAYSRAAAAFRRLSAPLYLALTGLDFVIVMGPDEPEARAAAEEAREIFKRLEAKPFVERLEGTLAPTLAS